MIGASPAGVKMTKMTPPIHAVTFAEKAARSGAEGECEAWLRGMPEREADRFQHWKRLDNRLD